MINIEKAKIDPTLVFSHPVDVLHANDLSREEKIDILKRWEYDEYEISVAEEENMQGNNHHTRYLEEILKCLQILQNNNTQHR